MRERGRGAVVAAGLVFALTGCASSAQSTTPAASRSMSTSATPNAVTSTGSRSAGPAPAAAAMVCGPEIQQSLQRHLQLKRSPVGASTWDGRQFRCVFNLSDGPLVLTVLQHESPSAATTSLGTQQQQLAGARKITGLAAFGLPAARADSGVVLFARDAFTLRVDTTAMKAPIGPFQRNRVDFAYAIAADVIACWQEHH